jgi:hypothetical protein
VRETKDADFPVFESEPFESRQNLKRPALKTPGMNVRHPKQRGEWVEFRFMSKAGELG